MAQDAKNFINSYSDIINRNNPFYFSHQFIKSLKEYNYSISHKCFDSVKKWSEYKESINSFDYIKDLNKFKHSENLECWLKEWTFTRELSELFQSVSLLPSLLNSEVIIEALQNSRSPALAQTLNIEARTSKTEAVKVPTREEVSLNNSKSFYVANDDYGEPQVYWGNKTFLKRGTGKHNIVLELIRNNGIATFDDIKETVKMDEDQLKTQIKAINSNFKKISKSEQLLIKQQKPKMRLNASLRQNCYPTIT